MLKKEKYLIPQVMKRYINNKYCFLALLAFASCGSSKEEKVTVTPQEVIASVDKVLGIGKVSPMEGFTTISNQSSGIVSKSMVKEGDSIDVGQLLFILQDSDQAFQAEQASAQLASLKASHEKWSNDLAKELLLLEEYENVYMTSKRLFEKQAETAEQLATHQRQWLQQQQLVEGIKIEQKAALLKEGELRLEVRNRNEKIADLEVKSSHKGVLLEWNIQLGQMIDPQLIIGKIGNPSAIHIEAEVDELFADKIQKGQEVELRYVGRPELAGMGEVVYVSPALSDKSILYEVPGEGEDRRVRKLHIKPKETKGWLINSKVECQINVK